MINLRVPRLLDLLVLLNDTPADEVEQYRAFNGGPFDHEEIAARTWLMPGLKWTIDDGAEQGPLAVFGGAWMRPEVLRTWYIPSPRAWERQNIRSVTRLTKTIITNVLLQGHARRIETMVLSSRTAARRWYSAIGLKYESTLPFFGSHGEEAMMYTATCHGEDEQCA